MADEVVRPQAPFAVAPDAFTTFREQRRFGSLDALRALAIVGTVWQHSKGPALWGDLIPGARFGFLGVDLFFVLSGFLIVTLLLRERETRRSISLKNFYIRRALRIFPLYYGLIACLAFLYYFVHPHGRGAEVFFTSLPYLLLYLTNWFPPDGILSITWSLAAEEQFYLLWPPIERFAHRFALPLLVTAIATSELIRFGVVDGFLEDAFGWGPTAPDMLRGTTFTPILLGVLAAHLLYRKASFVRMHAWLGHKAATPLLGLCLFVLMQFLPDHARGASRFAVHVLMFALVVSVVIREDHGLAGLCRHPLLVRIGVLSYGIYLLHNPALQLVHLLFARLGLDLPLTHFAISACLAYGMAALSLRYYETPWLKRKARYA